MGTAAAIGGAAVIGAVSSDRASKRGERATKSAAKTASRTQLEMFNRMNELQAPWRQVGLSALNEQALMLGLPGLSQDFAPEGITFDHDAQKPIQSLAESPMYKYEQQAMQKAAAAKGLLGSGRAIRDEGRLASDHFQRRLAQLGALSGAGGSMAQNIGQMGMNTAGNVGNLQMMAGQAGANRAIQQGNNVSNLINQGAQAYAMSNFNQPTGSYAAPQPQYAMQNPYAGQDVGLNFDPIGGM